MDNLMERYTALTTMATVPDDYCYQLRRLAVDFAAANRYAMAQMCKKRAEHYQYKIKETTKVVCGGEPVPYVTVA